MNVYDDIIAVEDEKAFAVTEGRATPPVVTREQMQEIDDFLKKHSPRLRLELQKAFGIVELPENSGGHLHREGDED